MADSPIGGFFEDAFEQGKGIAKQAGKQVVGLPASGAKSVMTQVAPGLTPSPKTAGDEKTEDSPDNKKKKQDPKPLVQTKNTTQVLRGQFIKQKPEDVVKEQQNLANVRQELHQNYYQDLVNRPKPKDEPVAEKLEREEKEEEQEEFIAKQKKADADAALQNVRQGTGEKLTGIGG